MKTIGLLGIVFGLVWLVLHFPTSPAPREYPAYCFNDTDNFKSDVCSKIGKQWSL